MSPSSKLAIGAKMVMSLGVPAVPILLWWKDAHDDRKAHTHEVETKVRIPNVQTVDDLLIERCQPGDVILFDRRCDRCAAGKSKRNKVLNLFSHNNLILTLNLGPMAAFSCVLGRSLLCDNKDDTPSYDHVGIVVPGNKSSSYEDDLELLEATPGEGIVSRPLLRRLEMTKSKVVTLLPLSSAGEYRNQPNYEPTEKTLKLRAHVEKSLKAFKEDAVATSQQQNYKMVHSLLGITGSIFYGLNIHELTPSPISPSAWLVVSALQSARVAENIDTRGALNVKPEDFLRDHRFYEKNVVRMRPGYKFLHPVTMRETARS